ncbi:MAG TPA: hypothetical protein VFA09_04075 [Ktedonobacteraceae bacterium]|jgi:hypothetical protein|nr:hypothetical protein [Ktedonobacteraceae bacterium]
MTTNAGQATNQDTEYNSLIKELMGSSWNLKGETQSEQAATPALAQTLVKMVAQSMEQASPYEKTMLVAALAPVIAEALAPVLAEALTPALGQALSNMATSSQSDQRGSSNGGSDNPEGQ